VPFYPPLDLAAINAELEPKSPQDILKWVEQTFGSRAALQSSMQKTASALSHMIHVQGFQADVLFVDTGVHFAETLATRDALSGKYGLRTLTLKPEKSFEEQRQEYGRDLYLKEGDYQICCQLRKEDPFVGWVQGRYDAVVGGLMRSEGGRRSAIQIVSKDERVEVYKIYPLANWDEDQVDAYNLEHEVPVHPLHLQGYPSIGCLTCTTPVRHGEDQRAGRWRHIREALEEPVTHLYCGINREDK
jgi:phosphoadenosine phosphosulfate reductase